MIYMCKYTPIELLKAYGLDLVLPNREVEDLSEADTLIHSNVCSHARQLLMASTGEEDLFLTNCCDSIRRVADTVETLEKRESRVIMMDLPHTEGSCAVDKLYRELKKLKTGLEAKGRSFDKDRFLKEWQQTASDFDMKKTAMTAGPYIAVMGARGGENLHKSIWRTMPYPTVDLTCLGARNLYFPPGISADMAEDDLLKLYAAELLRQLPCMRMAEVGSRRSLLLDPNLAGIIYNTIRFCDYYEFEYAGLRRETSVPILKIETDYTLQTQGQLLTRLEAFAEAFGIKKEAGNKKKDEKKAMTDHPIYIGIDSGSTTTNAVALNEKEEIVAFSIVRTGAKSGISAENALKEICEKSGLSREDMVHICATGYGRAHITFADSEKTEITCHARGAHYLDPKARPVIDIGGQDSKVICLDEEGHVANFIMNDKCAAGTGRFLEMMARTLEMPLSDMAEEGLKWKKDMTISSTCTVFAESEVISLIAENTETADIIHALNKAVAVRIGAMVSRAGGKAPYMMAGGVARNKSCAAEIEEKIGDKLFIAEHPDLGGAIGAALFAKEAANGGEG